MPDTASSFRSRTRSVYALIAILLSGVIPITFSFCLAHNAYQKFKLLGIFGGKAPDQLYPETREAGIIGTVTILILAMSANGRSVMGISQYDPTARGRPAWNAGKQVGVKRPLKVKQIWLIRFFLDREGRMAAVAGSVEGVRTPDFIRRRPPHVAVVLPDPFCEGIGGCRFFDACRRDDLCRLPLPMVQEYLAEVCQDGAERTKPITLCRMIILMLHKAS